MMWYTYLYRSYFFHPISVSLTQPSLWFYSILFTHIIHGHMYCKVHTWLIFYIVHSQLTLPCSLPTFTRRRRTCSTSSSTRTKSFKPSTSRSFAPAMHMPRTPRLTSSAGIDSPTSSSPTTRTSCLAWREGIRDIHSILARISQPRWRHWQKSEKGKIFRPLTPFPGRYEFCKQKQLLSSSLMGSHRA